MHVVAGPVYDVRAGDGPGVDAATTLKDSPYGNVLTASVVRGMVISVP